MAEVQAYLSGASAVKGVAAEAHLLGLVKDISPSTKQLYDMAVATATGAASGAGSDGVCTLHWPVYVPCSQRVHVLRLLQWGLRARMSRTLSCWRGLLALLQPTTCSDWLRSVCSYLVLVPSCWSCCWMIV